MRIQHNIMAMSAYRNYNNNNKALSGNLEKLSSGYKINRAGDDAAGLAISEKMRAQITGLNAASKNVKDGISLVKTAEGAMQEIQDMLNRMDYLATQSANGTYDNETDHAALQKEVDQLKTEIDRIADSANFNGIKLLDGSLDETRQASTSTIFSGLKGGSNVNGTAETTGANKGFGGTNGNGSLKLTGVNLAAAAGTAGASDKSVRYHKDAAVAGKTAFTVDFDGTDYSSATAGTSIEGLVFGLRSGEAATPGTGPDESIGSNVLYLDKAGTKRVTYNVTADNNGITSENIASSIMEAIEKNDGKVYIQAGMKTGGQGQEFIEYSVTRDGDKLRFEMTDDGYNSAVSAEAAAKTNGKGDNYFQGNFSFAVNYKKVITTGTAKDDQLLSTDATKKTEIAFTEAVVTNQQHEHTSNINEGTSPAGTTYAEAVIRFSTAGTGTGENKTTDVIKDGAGLQLGDEYYIFAGSDEVYNGEYADNVHVVDIRDLNKLGDATDTAGASRDLRLALDRLSAAAKDNEMFNVQVSHGGIALTVTERSTYSGDANLTMTDFGLENQIKTFSSATSKTTVTKEAGKALNLQIGDTSEEYNQMKVKVGDMHTSALKVADLDISTAESAAAAIDTIKAAINQVSSVRGDLGAYQNRLEHTANNLSVMAENIQDAESTIRDTDVAEEMMSYVKNNILVQSAQAMLAQANQVPQGVLQLLG